ncbi:MAG: leucine-rich repeat domain-containing protein [Deltaproteobacteria bacterium]|jgi:Leucine-rich repeat (LRR) protein|nr:leucine-rich repeat domain-containing protein [Deltaproteobacteria bacterium]
MQKNKKIILKITNHSDADAIRKLKKEDNNLFKIYYDRSDAIAVVDVVEQGVFYRKWFLFNQLFFFGANVHFYNFDIIQNNYFKLLEVNDGKLISLGLSESKIESIEALSGCNSLVSLDLSHTKINNLSPLSNCIDLKYLSLEDCSEITDISPLANCPNLTYLFISNNSKIIDFSPLSCCHNLTHLAIRGCVNISDGVFLSKLDKLRSLDLYSSPIPDLFPLSNLKNINKVNLQYNDKLKNISALSSLKSLEFLVICENKIIQDLTPLDNLTNLQFLAVANCRKLSNISSLSNLRNLTHLMLSFIGHTTDDMVFSLSKLINLKYLCLRGFSFSNLDFIKNLVNLEHLNLNYNDITNVSSLTNLTKLRKLELQSNSITDCKELFNVKSLEFLNISDNYINHNINFLTEMPNLKNVFVSHNSEFEVINEVKTVDFAGIIDDDDSYLEAQDRECDHL